MTNPNSPAFPVQSHEEKRISLIAKKSELHGQIARIKTLLMQRLPQRDFLKAEAARKNLALRMNAIDAEISAINLAKHIESQAENDRKKNDKIPYVKKLCELRDEYQQFAADGTRSPTMRRMAAEFVTKLNPIVRQAMNLKDL